jgi:hypothetical protein
MKKTIMSITLLSFLVSSASAFEMCGEDIKLGDTIKKSKEWTPNKTKSYGIEYDKYEKKEGFQTCQLFTERGESKIVKMVKKFKTDKPMTPPERLNGAPFEAGKTLYYKTGKKYEEIHSGVKDFQDAFRIGKKYLRFAKAEYKNKDFTASNNVMCVDYGKKCTSVVELRSNELRESYHPKRNMSKVNQRMNKIVESQNLELHNTKGWR